MTEHKHYYAPMTKAGCPTCGLTPLEVDLLAAIRELLDGGQQCEHSGENGDVCDACIAARAAVTKAEAEMKEMARD